jgi:putative Holliday junction resolvase
MRVLGLDVGTKRIGVAVSDELGLTAQGVTVIRRKGLREDVDVVLEIIKSYGVNQVVVGMPFHMNGSMGEGSRFIDDFVQELKKGTSLEVIAWDERFSTISAERTLLEADLSRAKRRKVVDKVAAVFILQGYLDHLAMRSKAP